MKLLLDTHLLLWAASAPERLSAHARGFIDDRKNEVWFSAVSLWEISIKSSLGRADFQVDVRLFRRALLDNGYRELPISGEDALAVGSLPPHHKDPFDRMLIAQATVEGVLLLTTDLIARDSGPVRRI